jgi:hypothetical protein
MKKRFLFALLFCYSFSYSQENLTKTDSVRVHPIRKSVVLSAILPGAGQFLNYSRTPVGKKGRNSIFWKIPLYYSALATTGYFLFTNQADQLSLKREYNDRISTPSVNPLNPKWEDYDNEAVLTLHQRYLTRRDLSILAFGGVYLFQIIEAGIGAHFANFDISDDLSGRIQPTLLTSNNIGLNLTLNFR